MSSSANNRVGESDSIPSEDKFLKYPIEVSFFALNGYLDVTSTPTNFFS